MKIKTKEDFEKTIEIEELAKIDDTQKIMLKSYLDVLLRGRKIRAACLFYSVLRLPGISTYHIEEDMPIKIPKAYIGSVKYELLLLFNELKRERKWTINHKIIIDYDEHNNEIDYHKLDDSKDVIVSKRITTTTKTEYFIDDSLDMYGLSGEGRNDKH